MTNHASRHAAYADRYFASSTYRRAMRRRALKEAAVIGFIALTLALIAWGGFYGCSAILGALPIDYS